MSLLLITHRQTSYMARPTTRESGSQEYFANSTNNHPNGGMGWLQGRVFCICMPLSLSSTKMSSVSFTNRRRDPVPEMTTPEQLYSKVTETLKFLNSHLPNGSHVFLSGLPDGTFLWDNLHDRYHPLGIGSKTHLLFNNVNVDIVHVYIVHIV